MKTTTPPGQGNRATSKHGRRVRVGDVLRGGGRSCFEVARLPWPEGGGAFSLCIEGYRFLTRCLIHMRTLCCCSSRAADFRCPPRGASRQTDRQQTDRQIDRVPQTPRVPHRVSENPRESQIILWILPERVPESPRESRTSPQKRVKFESGTLL